MSSRTGHVRCFICQPSTPAGRQEGRSEEPSRSSPVLATQLSRMGDLAGKIVVSIVDANGTMLTRQALTFKPEPTMSCQEVKNEIEAGGFGQGLLMDKDGDTLRLSQQVEAGQYKYRVTGEPELSSLVDRLCSPLPNPASYQGSVSTTGTSTNAPRFWPSAVQNWDRIIPDDTTSGDLQQAVIAFQTHPPTHLHNTRKPKIPSALKHAVSNEGEVRGAWAHVINVAETVQLPEGARWNMETSDKVIQDSVALSLPAALGSGTPRVAAAASTSKLRQDVVLSIALPADDLVGGEQSSAPKRRAICIGELKAPSKLWDPNEQAPLNLVQLCNDQQLLQGSCAHAVETVRQLYTYMAANCVLFGFISSWRYTWLARLLPTQTDCAPWLGKLYLSPPIASTARHTPQHPQMTVIGGVSWLQYQALQQCNQLPLPSAWHMPQAAPPSPSGAEAACGPSSLPLTGDTSSSDQADDSKDSDYAPSKTSGEEDACLHSQAAGADSVVWVARNQQPSEDATQQAHSLKGPTLLLMEKLHDGCYGAVYRGTCGGEAAVIKLLGPSAEGMAAFHREWDALRHLATAGVQAVPLLLGAGHLYLGMHAIATALVQGQPLSRVQPITPEVAAAAVHALAQVHASHPCLIHGDIRLENILLVAACPELSAAVASGDSSAPPPPQCKIIDFGASTFEGSAASQAEELRGLRQLLDTARNHAQ